jgi:hypothetical protein
MRDALDHSVEIAKLRTENARLREALDEAVGVLERVIDTRRCPRRHLRALNAARAALSETVS